ncbi:MAG: amidohydrolase family protein [Acetobacteraceae bacterium]
MMADPWNRYGPTAARPCDRPDRKPRPSGPTIDMHAHLFVPEAAEFARPHLSIDPRAALYAEETRILTRKQDEDRRVNLTDLGTRLADMDAMGVDRQIVSPAPGQCYHRLAPDLAVKAARLVNDGMAEFVARRPDRLTGLGTVPMQSGEAAVEELDRCVRGLGFKGVEVLANVGGKELSDPAHEALWAKAAELGTVVMIHPSGFTQPERLGRFYLNNVLGNPLETTIALHYLILDGVLERHPTLKLIAAHGGGFLPAYSGRIDHAWGARSDTHGDLPHAPSTYLKKVYVDAIVFTEHQLAALVALLGVGHVLMGTDYPYDMGEYDPIGHLAGLAAADTAAIAGGNALALFGI